ncbi:SDR family NAD(P)-dependent oxidoreductase [Halosimplex marinum]
MADFDGKTAIVTGASGGIGAAAANRFAEAGTSVAVTLDDGGRRSDLSNQ